MVLRRALVDRFDDAISTFERCFNVTLPVALKSLVGI